MVRSEDVGQVVSIENVLHSGENLDRDRRSPGLGELRCRKEEKDPCQNRHCVEEELRQDGHRADGDQGCGNGQLEEQMDGNYVEHK